MQFDQLKRREFITLSVARLRRSPGRSWRVRSSLSECGASACSTRCLQTILKVRPVLRRSHRVCRNGLDHGRNVRIDTRWAAGDAERFRRYAAELVALAPDILLATGAPAVGSLLQATRTVPIVFVNTADPVGAGFVETLARPGGNATGFLLFEYGISGKWLELLKQIAPGVTRVAVLRDPP